MNQETYLIGHFDAIKICKYYDNFEIQLVLTDVEIYLKYCIVACRLWPSKLKCLFANEHF